MTYPATRSGRAAPPPSPRAERSHRRCASAHEADDFAAYRNRGDQRAHERLVHAYLPLTTSIARRYERSRKVPLDDLKQVAAIGLLKAIDRFDPERGIAFASFAVPTIDGELKRYLRDFTWAVRPPRGLQERAQRMERDRDRLTRDLGRNPTMAELAEGMGCSVEELVEGSEAARARSTESFEFERDDMSFALADRIGAEDTGFAAAEASATAERLLTMLSERERRAIHLRFNDDLTQAEIASRLGCSQMHVSRILRQALARLADEVGSQPGCERQRFTRQ
jgi:RNA polymerase sigma-B factor